MVRVLAALLGAACASAPSAPAGSPESFDEQAESRSGAEAGTPGAPGADGGTRTATAPPTDPSTPVLAPAGANSLPEMKVRSVGLHVGGGRNDRASKEPFLRAIERQFPDLLRCYALVDEPGQEGTFGIDLHILTSGAVSRWEQPRPGLAGEAFRSCVLRVFEKISFDPIAAPVVVSYSVRFSFRD